MWRLAPVLRYHLPYLLEILLRVDQEQGDVHYMAKPHLASGELVALFDDWQLAPKPLHAPVVRP